MIGALLLFATAAPAFAGVVDAGFENGTDGAPLASPPWTLSGVPQHAEYDTTHVKSGALSGWIQGPTTAAAAGASAPAVMTSNGSEYRFWAYVDTANRESLRIRHRARSLRCA